MDTSKRGLKESQERNQEGQPEQDTTAGLLSTQKQET